MIQAKVAEDANKFDEALAFYEKAAEQGHAAAQCSCGLMYYKGEGTAVDNTKAKLYLQKVAAQTEDKASQKMAKEVLRDPWAGLQNGN